MCWTSHTWRTSNQRWLCSLLEVDAVRSNSAQRRVAAVLEAESMPIDWVKDQQRDRRGVDAPSERADVVLRAFIRNRCRLGQCPFRLLEQQLLQPISVLELSSVDGDDIPHFDPGLPHDLRRRNQSKFCLPPPVGGRREGQVPQFGGGRGWRATRALVGTLLVSFVGEKDGGAARISDHGPGGPRDDLRL